MANTWSHLTQNSKLFQIWSLCKMRDTYYTKYNYSERKTLLEWLDFFLTLMFSKLCLVYYWEYRDLAKFWNSKEEYKTVFFNNIAYIFVLIFSWKTPKSSKQFDQNEQFFPTSSTCVSSFSNSFRNYFCYWLIPLSTLGFFFLA